MHIIGLCRVKIKIGMMNMVFNMKRLMQSMRRDRIGMPVQHKTGKIKGNCIINQMIKAKIVGFKVKSKFLDKLLSKLIEKPTYKDDIKTIRANVKG